jgi:MFS family permease
MIGKLSDRFGKYNMFVIGSAISSLLVGIFCNLGTTPQIIMVINVFMFGDFFTYDFSFGSNDIRAKP